MIATTMRTDQFLTCPMKHSTQVFLEERKVRWFLRDLTKRLNIPLDDSMSLQIEVAKAAWSLKKFPDVYDEENDWFVD